MIDPLVFWRGWGLEQFFSSTWIPQKVSPGWKRLFLFVLMTFFQDHLLLIYLTMKQLKHFQEKTAPSDCGIIDLNLNKTTYKIKDALKHW